MRSFACLLFILGTSASAQAADNEAAKQCYTLAEERAAAGDHEQAVAAYCRAYRLSGRPIMLTKIALAHEERGDQSTAFKYYREYLRIMVARARSEKEEAQYQAASLRIRETDPKAGSGRDTYPDCLVTIDTTSTPIPEAWDCMSDFGAVDFTSDPEGAEVIAGSAKVCTSTPCRVSLVYGRHEISMSLPGHKMAGNTRLLVASTKAQFTGRLLKLQPPYARQRNTDLVWQRCAVGQSWDGLQCTGTATPGLDYQGNMAACDTGFRLPSRAEYRALLGDCRVKSAGGDDRCNKCSQSQICSEMFGDAGGEYWASEGKDLYRVAFGSGAIYRSSSDGALVRCVRGAGQPEAAEEPIGSDTTSSPVPAPSATTAVANAPVFDFARLDIGSCLLYSLMPIGATIAGGVGIPFVPILQVWMAGDGMNLATILRVGLGYGLYAASIAGGLGLAVALPDQGGLLWGMLLVVATFYVIEPPVMWLTRGFSPASTEEAEAKDEQSQVSIKVGPR